MMQYIKSIGVRIVSCFDRTLLNSRYADNKTFRICVLDADRDKLLSADNWPIGVCIEKWKFKPKKTDGERFTDRNGAGAGDAASGAARGADDEGPPGPEGSRGGVTGGGDWAAQSDEGMIDGDAEKG